MKSSLHSLIPFCLSLDCLLKRLSQSQSQIYVTTDSQSASLSWNKAPIWVSRPELYYCMTFEGLLKWGALSDDRAGLSFAKVRISLSLSILLDPRYTASGRIQQKISFPKNSSIIIEVCLPRRCIETVVLLLLCACLFP
jgi:hypothetical protein